jgi:hypothetical protein
MSECIPGDSDLMFLGVAWTLRLLSRAQVTYTCNLFWRQKSGGSWFKGSPGQIIYETLSQKNPLLKRAGTEAQVERVSACQV